jgi:hypothetical protein
MQAGVSMGWQRFHSWYCDLEFKTRVLGFFIVLIASTKSFISFPPLQSDIEVSKSIIDIKHNACLHHRKHSVF